PPQLFHQIFAEAIAQKLSSSHRPLLPAHWQSSYDKFTAWWIADGSTLEVLRKKLKAESQDSEMLGGKMMMVVEAFEHHPVAVEYTQQSRASDQSWMEKLLEKLPVGGLLIFDLGFFNFAWFDKFSERQKYFVTRLRSKTAYQTRRCLSQGSHYKDEIIKMGVYRSNPCHYEVRLVSVLWGKTWYYYLTNVLDPTQLSAQQVCELYRRRWRIEEAFLLTKRLLGLAYLWVGGKNGVEIQVYTTWIFYTVLNDLCGEVAKELSQPKERISVEMVFRGLYHFSRAVSRGENVNVVTFLLQHHQVLSLVKAQRKRHRQHITFSEAIWGSTA
ncbi:IS4 family transposase, partial [Oscillatoria sp. FACHB-1406]|uniref:IS4 family transposase n=1 Tax=Oscillatoria sp. FACHB-1406 TaxID=2692846 RepID=UPI001687FAA9